MCPQNGSIAWNNITTKVNISEVSNPPAYFGVAAYAGVSIPSLDVNAVCDYYTYGLFGYTAVAADDARDRTRLRIDNTNMSYVTDANVKKDILIHEFGHVLSLQHNNNSGNSIMKTAVTSTFGAPQATDISHIKEKWGN
ncbi:hypothetical protein HQN90_27455 [Paenibacillus alba]|uniref:hypothetical protein n=1 Tax=Paenibacillus alba TaxID=1197127 RepID=UPI0015664F9D|nr:hypothetical protein [Paenibacillus alba]NQX69875.1 hypothetical protein [Paenibacillus alba]